MFQDLTLLYVEDDNLYIDLVIELLQPQFKKIHIAKNGRKGVELYHTLRPDIILSDVTMPVMSGVEMAAEIKESDAEVPIVLLSGQNDIGAITDAINIGVDGYLFKPIDPDKMHTLLTKLAGNIRNKRQLVQEQKLLEEYKKAVDASALVSKTDVNGMITYANEAFCEISGYTKEELIGKNHNIIRHPDVPDALFKDLWETILDKRIWKGTLKNRKKDGSEYYIAATIVPILDENDEIIQFLSFRHDVTELERHRKELEKLVKQEVEKNNREREAREQERLKAAKFLAIGRLAAGITHEINTPLTYMRGNLEMMLGDIERLEPSQVKTLMLEDAQSVMDGISRIAGIVESMREMASQSSEQMEAINIYHTLQTALIMAHNRAKQITPIQLQGALFKLGMDKDAFHFSALAQRQRIEQVWVIIINNALDVLQHVEPFEKRSMNITIDETPEEVVVCFTDTGGGIDEAMLPKIFDPFESSKTDGGMGIGLNLAKKIVDDHHGRIEASNTPEGAKFCVHLPKQ